MGLGCSLGVIQQITQQHGLEVLCLECILVFFYFCVTLFQMARIKRD